MISKRDPELTDEELQREIELVGEFVVAAAGSDGPLSEEDIDRVLGLDVDEAAEPETTPSP